MLSRLLQPDVLAEHDIVGLSDTSGGAICATLAWSALLADSPQNAEDLLARFWAANTATTAAERAVNSMILWGGRLAETVALPAINPYLNVGAQWSSQHLARMVDDVVDLPADQARATELGDRAPLLLLGAVDVLNGAFRAFSSRDGEIATPAILASAAIPTLFRSVRIDKGVYWDGLFSQNPPISDLWACDPDEIWVIQINPTSIADEPTQLADITNRRNELSGNLSLYQELRFLETLDRWLADGTIRSDTLRHVNLRILEMKRLESTKRWGYASKLNRDPAFIAELMELGRLQAEEMLQVVDFERAWNRGDRAAMIDRLASDVLVSSDHPEAPLEPTRDRVKIRAFVDELGLSLDASRKRVCRDQVIWDVRATGHARLTGRAVATLDDGALTRLAITGVTQQTS